MADHNALPQRATRLHNPAAPSPWTVLIQTMTRLELSCTTTYTALVYWHRYRHYVLTTEAGQAQCKPTDANPTHTAVNSATVLPSPPSPSSYPQPPSQALPVGSLDEHMLALACILLATKAANESRSVQDIVSSAYSVYFPHDPYLQPGEQLTKLKDTLYALELLLLRFLGFNLAVEAPFAWVRYGVEQCRERLPDGYDWGQVMQVAWALANDSAKCPQIVILHSGHHIAKACVYLALALTRPSCLPRLAKAMRTGQFEHGVLLCYCND
ncbi:hypothetical protein H4R35_006786 [Dimargaris xerosporica]|nr:hypothetical protein H4R35_006786 [Dimargaris xerosporica]